MVNQPEFADAIARARRNMEHLRSRASTKKKGAALILPEALEELQITLEELQVAEEELHRKHQQLAETAHAADAERHRYRELFDFAPDAYMVTDRAGIIQDANGAAVRLFGVRCDLLRGKPLANYVAQRDRAVFRRSVNNFAQSDGVTGWEITLQPRAEAAMAVEITVTPARAPDSTVTGLRWMIRDIAERRRSQDQLQASERRYRTLVETAPSAIINVNVPDWMIVLWNDEAQRVYGWPAREALNQNFLTLCIPAEMQASVKAQLAAAANGQTQRFETHVRAKDGGSRILLCCAARLPASADHAPELTICCQDITERLEVAHHRLLVAEIEHRVKNNLATVLAIADQTAARSKSLDDFKQAFRGRVIALAQMHTLLSQSNSQGVDLQRLIQQALSPYVTERGPHADIDGEPIMLTAKAAQCLAITLHEMTTNAAKYGALTVPTGTVQVHWQIVKQDEKDHLQLRWIESGGPTVTPPTHHGLGWDLSRQCVQHELRGKADVLFEPQGVQSHIDIPFDAAIGARGVAKDINQAVAAAALAAPPEATPTAFLAGQRVLLVEDTALVAREVERILKSMGCQVIGPVATLEDAMEAVQQQSFDAALLDVNLNGLDSWPVAEELLDRDVPFILTTGFACPASLPPEFRHCAFLEKPFDQKELVAKLAEVLAQHSRAGT